MKDTAEVFKTETFGAVDGPGVRLVIFLQGCTFRCKYCHNPESWNFNNPQAKKMSVDDIISLYERNKEFYTRGGITISGGEPMLSPDFIKLLAKKCKEKKIHLAIDTSACNFLENKDVYEELIELIDLWIVDVKAMDKQQHKFITGSEKLTGIEFIKFLESKNKPYWLRQVIVKTINDDLQHVNKLGDFIKTLKYCQKYELLDYHNLATEKYEKLGIPYPFKDMKVQNKSEFDNLKIYLKNYINNK